MLIDKYLSNFCFSEYHETAIYQSPSNIFPLIKTTNFTKSKLIKSLFKLRGLPSKMDSLNGFMQCGFICLEEKQDEEIVLGFLLGLGGLKLVMPQEFIEYNDMNYAKGVFNFRINQHGNASILSTETRVHCENVTRIFFILYWSLVSRFSAITRIEMLRLIKHEAELLSED